MPHSTHEWVESAAAADAELLVGRVVAGQRNYTRKIKITNVLCLW